MSAKDQAPPCGVIAIMTSASGHVVATAADFERQGFGGCELWEAQKYRATREAKWATVRAYCSNVVVGALDEYLAEQIADRLLSKGGHILVCRAIGYSEDVRREVEGR